MTMTISDLQQWVRDDWEHHSPAQPTLLQQVLFIVEEVGEIAEAIRKNDGGKRRIGKQADLGGEMADLIISVTTLANHFDIDLASELTKFQQKQADRHQQGF